MRVDQALSLALTRWPALAGVRAYPSVASDGAVSPYIVYRQYAGSRVSDMGGDAGLANPLFQIDVYARDLQRAAELKQAVLEAVLASPLKATARNDDSDYEPDTKLYRYRQEFSCWFND